MLRIGKVGLLGLMVILGLVCVTIAQAQDGDVAAVKAKFGNLTRSEAEKQGWKVDELCIDGSSLGMGATSGAMGFHASMGTMGDHDMGAMGMETKLDPMQPQELVFDSDSRIVAVEYQVPQENGKAAPVLFGQTLQETPPHVGMEMNHWSLHLWLVDNPSGQFAMFNPNVQCPADRVAPNINKIVSMPGAEPSATAQVVSMDPVSGGQGDTGTMPGAGKGGSLSELGSWALLAIVSLAAGAGVLWWMKRSAAKRSGNL
jgi:hypothetical protein